MRRGENGKQVGLAQPQQSVEELTRQIDRLMCRIHELKTENERLRLQNDYLKSELVENRQDLLKSYLPSQGK